MAKQLHLKNGEVRWFIRRKNDDLNQSDQKERPGLINHD